MEIAFFFRWEEFNYRRTSMREGKSLTPITLKLIQYREGKISKHTALKEVSIFSYSMMKKAMKLEDDQRSDFFIYLYPRLSNLVENFTYRGMPFEVYLMKTLRWQFKTFSKKRTAEDRRQRLLSHSFYWAVSEYPAEYNPPIVIEDTEESMERYNKIVKQRGPNSAVVEGQRRRFLFLILKTSPQLSEELLDHISLVTGYEKEYLTSCIDELHKKIDLRMDRHRRIWNKRNKYFFRVHFLQDSLIVECNKKKREKLMKQLEETHTRLTKISRIINRLSTAPTHREISEVLGVPKGTIDSGLYYLRRDFRRCFGEEEAV